MPFASVGAEKPCRYRVRIACHLRVKRLVLELAPCLTEEGG